MSHLFILEAEMIVYYLLRLEHTPCGQHVRVRSEGWPAEADTPQLFGLVYENVSHMLEKLLK